MKMDKWTQQLHDKLAEREVAPPDDLWADIEAALPKDLAGSKKPRARFVPLRRWAVAARSPFSSTSATKKSLPLRTSSMPSIVAYHEKCSSP